MRLTLIAAIAVLAACDQSPRVDEDKVNTQMLENVAVQRNETADIGATARLEPLPMSEAPAAGPACAFVRDGRVLLVATAAGARARIRGETRSFRPAGPVGALGGFWRDRELAISIGIEPGQSTRARVTNRLTETQEDHFGQWQCRQ